METSHVSQKRDSHLSQLREWKRIILKLKDLEKPDGRQLYKYRVSNQEFDALEEFLRGWIADALQSSDFSVIASLPGFSDLFVLYCSEWWRRRYAGEGFKWDPIFSDLGIPANSLTQQQRSRCVERGLRSWGLSLSRSGGHTYIGSVASQGGLPMKLLAAERSGIGTLVSRVLRHAKTTAVSSQDLHGWVESLDYLLPKSFRQSAIFLLITDITWTVLDLKEKAGLGAVANPIVQLDEKVPDWRDRFPLSFEDNQAEGLIEQLLKEAARIRPERRNLVLPVERTLEKNDDTWKFCSRIDLPQSIRQKDLIESFGLDEQDLPRGAELSILAGDSHLSTSIRRITGREAYRISGIPLEFSGVQSSREHLLRLTSPDGRTWTAAAPRGSALDVDLPWLFAEEESQHRFVRQGGGSVAAQSAVVAVPQDWILRKLDENSALKIVGTIEESDRCAYAFSGPVEAVDKSGNAYKLRTGNAGETEESYEWVGTRLWYELRSPSVAFRGKPTLHIVREDGSKPKAPGELKYSATGGRESASYGPLEVRYPATGEIKHRSRMLVLPVTSSLRLEPIDAHSGRVVFDGWKASVVTTSTPNVQTKFVNADGTIFLDVTAEKGTRTPETIDFEIFWNHTPTPVAMRVPFPAHGVRGFDHNGRELPPFSQLAVQDLLGSRLTVMGLQSGTRVNLKLKAADKDVFRKYEIKPMPGSLATEIRIADYRREIDHLHTIDDNPDSTVTLTVEIGGEPRYQLSLLPYQVRPERDELKFWIEAESVLAERIASPEVQALALALERPGEEPHQLDKLAGGNGERTLWNFFPEDRDEGSWLIYPPKDTAIQFRPMLWSVGTPSESENQYVRAISIRDRAERGLALDAFIEAIASDFEHPGWIEVNQLASQVGHLPLSALDMWRRFVRSSKAMAALALRYNSFRGEFLSRFDNELPFSWDTVTFIHWQEAARDLEQQTRVLFGGEQGPKVFELFLKSRIGDLVAESGSLAYLLNIILAGFLDDSANKDDTAIQKELADLRLYPSEFVLFGDRRSRDSSLLMKLLTGQDPDEKWPVLSTDLLASAKANKSISQYLCPQSYGVKDSVINLPIVLATQVAFGESGKWFSDPKAISVLHDYRSFDSDWFDEAYNLTIARCLADGVFD